MSDEEYLIEVAVARIFLDLHENEEKNLLKILENLQVNRLK